MGGIPVSWDYKNPWILREHTIRSKNPRTQDNSRPSCNHEILLIAVLVVALAIASESASLVKRDAPAELDKIAKYFQDLVDNLKNVEGPELVNKANAYLEQSRAQFQPMVEKLQEQLKPLSSNIEEQIKPLTASVQAQVAPLAGMVQTHVEDILKLVADKTKDILPPQ